MDHLEEEAQKGDEQQGEMVQSIDNDNQESARLLQERVEQTIGWVTGTLQHQNLGQVEICSGSSAGPSSLLPP